MSYNCTSQVLSVISSKINPRVLGSLIQCLLDNPVDRIAKGIGDTLRPNKGPQTSVYVPSQM